MVSENRITVRFLKEGNEGTIGLFLNGEECGTVKLPYVVRMMTSTGMDIGRNSLSPIAPDYEKPFAFSGTIKKVKIKMLPYTVTPEEAKNWFREEMSRQ